MFFLAALALALAGNNIERRECFHSRAKVAYRSLTISNDL